MNGKRHFGGKREHHFRLRRFLSMNDETEFSPLKQTLRPARRNVMWSLIPS